MATFGWPLRISGMDERGTRELEAIVDTGAAYHHPARPPAPGVGVEPPGRRRVRLADGRRADIDYGQAWVPINDERVVTIVVFGDNEAPPRLGAYTLHGLALAVDPVGQRPVPARMILYAVSTGRTGADRPYGDDAVIRGARPAVRGASRVTRPSGTRPSPDGTA